MVELSIVIMIVSILSIALINAYSLYYNQYRLTKTSERISKIENALEDFLLIKSRLPCASPRNVPRTDSAYGREENCTIASPNTARAPGKKGKSVRIGLVPTRTLGIGDEYAVDGWGRLLTYAVSEEQASEITYAADGGGIDVLDESGTSRLISLGNFAYYVIVSSGPSGEGGYNKSGTPYLPCNEGASEGENCNDDAVFLESVRSEASNADYFDDKISYASVMAQLPEENKRCLDDIDVTLGNRGIAASSAGPSGELVEFFGSNCPTGWEVADRSISPGFIPLRNYDREIRGNSRGTEFRDAPKFINKMVGQEAYFISQQRLPTTLNGNDLNTSVLCSKKENSNNKQACFESSNMIFSTGLSSGITPKKLSTMPDRDGQIGHEEWYSGTPKCPDGWTVTAIIAPRTYYIDRKPDIDIRCAR